MSFLNKLGSVLAKGIGIASVVSQASKDLGYNQSLDPYADYTNNEMVLLASVITDTEAIKQTLSLPGDQALKAATPRVSQIILKSALMIGKVVTNPGLFNRGCSKIADGFVDILDAVQHDNVVDAR